MKAIFSTPLFVLFLAGLFPSVLSAANIEIFENQIVPFVSDGCSAAPDKVLGQDLSQCCQSHDFAYWKGGSHEEKVHADGLLKECVNAQIPGLGYIFEAGVHLGGSPNLTTSWKWGYGWILDRGYTPLSPEEREKVAAVQGDMDNVSTQPVGWMGRQHSITGDHCLDKALNFVMKNEGRSQLFYSVQAQHVRGSPEGLVYTFEITKYPDQCLHSVEVLTLPGWQCDADTVSELGVRGGIRIQSESVDCQ